MKSMRSFVRQGENHSHRRNYGADLQRRMADEGAISCIGFGGTEYWDVRPVRTTRQTSHRL